MSSHAHRAQWTLDPTFALLNHGSFGACPREVLAYQSELRARLERQPVQFFVRDGQALLDEVRERLAAFLGADPTALAFVNNATSGVNAVLRSLDFATGDELLVSSHAYGACRNALDFVASRAGARVVCVDIPFPGTTPEEVITRFTGVVTDRTRLALVDHVTSPTGLVLPLREIVRALDARGVDTLVDGAHAPGMLELDLGEIGAAYYTGNCHKWICAPKGAAFLHVRADRQSRVRPLVISFGASAEVVRTSRFLAEFDWTGTDDPTAIFSVGVAIETMGGMLPGGWPELRAHNRQLALAARRVLCDRLAIPLPAPDEMIGSLATVPLPAGPPEPPTAPLHTDPLQDALLAHHRIEVPVMPWGPPPMRLVRISAQLYNTIEEYEALADALVERL